MDVMRCLSLGAVLVIGASCRTNPGLEDSGQGARVVTGGTGVQYGDCAEALRRAEAKPDLDVDTLARIVRQRPAAFTRPPWSVQREIDTKGSNLLATVVIDTLGHPVMKTFTVERSTPTWLAGSLKSVLPRWTFTPAYLAGCKVPRVYKFMVSSKPKRR